MEKNACQLVTQRLILRIWQESDAESLYKYAKDPEIGPIAGWPPHSSVEDSLNVIRTVFAAPETYAVVLKESNEPVGSIGIMFGDGLHSAEMQVNEAEIGYWIGKPYWGQGLIPEAVRRLLRRCFEDLGMAAVWCGYYDGNTKSRRVMEKCGFRFHHTEEGKTSSLGDVRTEHFMWMTKEEWEQTQKENYAARMCDKLGFKTTRESDEGHVMTKDLSSLYRIRPLTEQDIPEMRTLFRATVLAINSKDYTQEEVEDWASCGDRAEYWKKLLSMHNYIAALDGKGDIIGFSSMNTDGYLHSMFVHKDWQRKGVASLLLSEVEKMACKYNAHQISVEASITARPFFEKHGYNVVKQQKAKANRLYLTNYVMEKAL